MKRLREGADDGSGFALIELLVVLLVLGALAAIALPSFLSQRDKARDGEAKVAVSTARTAIEVYSTDHDGSYLGASPNALAAIERSLTGLPAGALQVDDLGPNQYRLTVSSSSGNLFSISRGVPPAPEGAVIHACEPAGSHGCPPNGRWD